MVRDGKAWIWGVPIALIAALALWISASTARATLVQEEAAAVEVGAGPIRETAWSLVGRSIYTPETITLFGYFTALKQIDSALLFVEDSASEQTARFTFAGEIELTDRVERGDVTSVTGNGAIRVYFTSEAGSDWSDPASFSRGQQLAEFEVDLRETLHRQGPGTGLLVGDSTLLQVSSEQFTVDAETFRFGAPRIALRLRTVGAVMSADGASGYTSNMTGTAAVTERPLTPVQMGGPATPTAAPSSATGGCEFLEPWLSETRASLAAAAELTAPLLAADASAGLDIDAASAAAAESAVLASAQREIAVPEGGEEANRLAVTALSTYARGLQTIADGASAGDEELIRQGLAVAGDGGSLAGRAEAAIDSLATTCAGEG